MWLLQINKSHILEVGWRGCGLRGCCLIFWGASRISACPWCSLRGFGPPQSKHLHLVGQAWLYHALLGLSSRMKGLGDHRNPQHSFGHLSQHGLGPSELSVKVEGWSQRDWHFRGPPPIARGVDPLATQGSDPKLPGTGFDPLAIQEPTPELPGVGFDP